VHVVTLLLSERGGRGCHGSWPTVQPWQRAKRTQSGKARDWVAHAKRRAWQVPGRAANGRGATAAVGTRRRWDSGWAHTDTGNARRGIVGKRLGCWPMGQCEAGAGQAVTGWIRTINGSGLWGNEF
jgi:hypothetical protein